MAFYKILPTTVILIFASAFAYGQSAFLSTCAQDAHIGAAKKSSIDAEAITFANALMESKTDKALDMLSNTARKVVTPEQITSTVSLFRQFEARNIAIQHTYVVDIRGPSPASIVCANDITTSDWVALGIENIPEQGYVALSANMRNNDLAIIIWLTPEGKSWKVNAFWFNISTLANKDSKKIAEVATEQKAKGHSMNATLLYAAASQTANRGPNFQLGITQVIAKDTADLVAPIEVRGTPPFLWKSGKTTFKVLNVGPIAIAGKLYITINHEVPPNLTNAEMDASNKDLLRYFKSRFPEYSDVFSGLVARANAEGGNRGFGTVEEVSPASH